MCMIIFILFLGFFKILFDNLVIFSFFWLSFCCFWLNSSVIFNIGGGVEDVKIWLVFFRICLFGFFFLFDRGVFVKMINGNVYKK